MKNMIADPVTSNVNVPIPTGILPRLIFKLMTGYPGNCGSSVEYSPIKCELFTKTLPEHDYP